MATYGRLTILGLCCLLIGLGGAYIGDGIATGCSRFSCEPPTASPNIGSLVLEASAVIALLGVVLLIAGFFVRRYRRPGLESTGVCA
jgi:hypothetical protein